MSNNWGMCYWCKRDVKQAKVPEHIENGDPIHNVCYNEYCGLPSSHVLELSQIEIKQLKVLLEGINNNSLGELKEPLTKLGPLGLAISGSH